MLPTFPIGVLPDHSGCSGHELFQKLSALALLSMVKYVLLFSFANITSVCLPWCTPHFLYNVSNNNKKAFIIYHYYE